MNTPVNLSSCDEQLAADSIADVPHRLDIYDCPSWCLRAGFVRRHHAGGWYWQHVRLTPPLHPELRAPSPAAVDALYGREEVRALLEQLAETFAPFLPLDAAQWEEDLRQSPYPDTLLRLWETVLGVYDYYVTGKKHLAGAPRDYFWLLVGFCNAGNATGIPQENRFDRLTPGRVKRVADELRRWFAKEGQW